MKIKIDKNALWDYLCNEGLAVLNNKNPGNDYKSKNMKSVIISKDGTVTLEYSMTHHDGCDEIKYSY